MVEEVVRAQGEADHVVGVHSNDEAHGQVGARGEGQRRAARHGQQACWHLGDSGKVGEAARGDDKVADGVQEEPLRRRAVDNAEARE